jgi:hypothetical protein
VRDSRFEPKELYFHWTYPNYIDKVDGKPKTRVFKGTKLKSGLSGNRSAYSSKQCVICNKMFGFDPPLADSTPVLTIPVDRLPFEILIAHVPTPEPSNYSHCELQLNHPVFDQEPASQDAEARLFDVQRCLRAVSEVEYLRPTDGCTKCPIVVRPHGFYVRRLRRWLRARITTMLQNLVK